MKKNNCWFSDQLRLIGLLAGCGTTKLTTTKTNYRQNGMVAVVKGSTTKKKLIYNTGLIIIISKKQRSKTELM